MKEREEREKGRKEEMSRGEGRGERAKGDDKDKVKGENKGDV